MILSLIKREKVWLKIEIEIWNKRKKQKKFVCSLKIAKLSVRRTWVNVSRAWNVAILFQFYTWVNWSEMNNNTTDYLNFVKQLNVTFWHSTFTETIFNCSQYSLKTFKILLLNMIRFEKKIQKIQNNV